MNDQFNNYNNQGYNGYNQQPMNQGYGQPGYNQQQSPNKGKGVVGVIVVVVIIIGLVVFLLNYSGVINLKGKSKDSTETKEVSDKKDSSNNNKEESKKEDDGYKDSLKALCSKVDNSGDYNYAEYSSRIEQSNKYIENKEYAKSAELFNNFMYCEDGVCKTQDKEGHYYDYSCYEDKYYPLNDFMESNQYNVAQAVLTMACSTNVSFEDVKCENNVCKTTYSDQANYSLDCNQYNNWASSIKNK